MIHTHVFISVDVQLCSEQTANMSTLAYVTFTHSWYTKLCSGQTVGAQVCRAHGPDTQINTVVYFGITRGYNKIYKITKTEMGSPCNENGEYKNYQKNNRMDAI